MRRRAFMVFLASGMMVWPLGIYAQQSQKIFRVGVLLPGTPASFSLRTKAFLDGLRELGYVEGATIAFEWKWGQDRVETLSGLAADLARSNVDVIITGGTSAAKALKAATPTIPIVVAIVSDPVAAGLVDNLARPGGNLTGFSMLRRNWAESVSNC
jgi:putative tryptophan/tyrosine transport system substrate-binding protein